MKTVSDFIDELDYCAGVITDPDAHPEICRWVHGRPAAISTYLECQEAGARRASGAPLADPFRWARVAYDAGAPAVAIDILRGAAVRLHRQYILERVLP